MLQTFRAVPFQSAVQPATALLVNTAKGNTTTAIEIAFDFQWLLNGN